MPIVVDIDVMLARRKMSVGTLADRVGVTPANIAVLKNNRAKAVRFSTLEALCEVLPGRPEVHEALMAYFEWGTGIAQQVSREPVGADLGDPGPTPRWTQHGLVE